MTAFETYQEYLALKKHFDSSSSYDYFKYHGRLKINKQSFDSRRDKFYFKKISTKFQNRNELVNFFVSGFIKNPKLWIRDFVGSYADDSYMKWKAYQESLTYNFQQDVSKIRETHEGDFSSLFICVDNQHPPLLNLCTNSDISTETLIGVDVVVSCFEDWNKKIDDPIIWPGLYDFYQKYRPFLKIDDKKYRQILRNEFSEKELNR